MPSTDGELHIRVEKAAFFGADGRDFMIQLRKLSKIVVVLSSVVTIQVAGERMRRHGFLVPTDAQECAAVLASASSWKPTGGAENGATPQSWCEVTRLSRLRRSKDTDS